MITQNIKMVIDVQEREDRIHADFIEDMHEEFRQKGLKQDENGKWYKEVKWIQR